VQTIEAWLNINSPWIGRAKLYYWCNHKGFTFLIAPRGSARDSPISQYQLRSNGKQEQASKVFHVMALIS